MQYQLKTAAVNATATTTAPRVVTTTAPRVVDAHSLLHLQASKAAKACDAADAVDGLVVVQNPTMRIAAFSWGVSVGSVARALWLTPEQRQAVRQEQRPLVLPRAPSAPPALPVLSTAPATPPVPPVVMGPRERLEEIVSEIGFNATLDLLAAGEQLAA